jgi:hypothetical protein
MACAVQLAGPTVAEQAGPDDAITDDDAREIRRLLREHSAAICTEDAVAAFRLASSAQQEKHRRPARYLKDTRRRYAPLYEAPQYKLGDVSMTPWGLGLPIWLRDAAGQLQGALFLLDQAEDGSWRTDGCILFEAEETQGIAVA